MRFDREMDSKMDSKLAKEPLFRKGLAYCPLCCPSHGNLKHNTHGLREGTASLTAKLDGRSGGIPETLTGCAPQAVSTTFKFDPRDFISPPFVSCPECSQPSFGILRVGPDTFVRRCRNCFHMRDFGLPAVRKTILYLDQFVISNLMLIAEVRPASPGDYRN